MTLSLLEQCLYVLYIIHRNNIYIYMYIYYYMIIYINNILNVFLSFLVPPWVHLCVSVDLMSTFTSTLNLQKLKR